MAAELLASRVKENWKGGKGRNIPALLIAFVWQWISQLKGQQMLECTA